MGMRDIQAAFLCLAVIVLVFRPGSVDALNQAINEIVNRFSRRWPSNSNASLSG